MSASTPSKYTFLPWVKMGLGASISNNEKDLQGPRAKIQVELSVRRFDRSNNPSDDLISKDFLLYGPGDITGILNNVIIRIQPRANDLNFEPNYFPFIEFSQPDFPWRYTPAVPHGSQPSGRLSPWITLIVLKEQEFEHRSTTTTTNTTTIEPGLLPQIIINDPVSSLPDLDQCWAWAHTQISQEITNPESLLEILASEPHKVISRILSLRKLESNSRYFAFLVPTFEVGRLAGLGVPIDGNIKGTIFAWKVRGSPSEISPMQHVLPVYYQWEFSTSLQTGDFESLVAKLEDRILSKEVGLQKLDVSEPFLSVDIGKDTGFNKPLFFGGVLWSPLAAKEFAERKKIDVRRYFIGPDPESPSGEAPDPESPSREEIKEFIMEMKDLVDLGERLSWSFVKGPFGSNELKDPIISPPMYGKWHARKRLVSKISNDNKDPLWIQSLDLDLHHPDWEKIRNDHPYEWLEELNLDPTNRIAAGLGAAVIQELQEELMASAWDQAGSLRETNKRLRLSQLARTISSNLFERCFQPLEGDVLITMTRPFHTKVILNEPNKSVARLIQESPIPNAIFTPSFTKITAKRSKVHRMLFDRNTHISFHLLGTLNEAGNPDVHAATIEDSNITIDHLVGSVSEDNFQGNELEEYLDNQLISNHIREMVKTIEKSIPRAMSTVAESQRKKAPLENIYERLKESLDPVRTIELKVSMEVTRPERLQEEKKDKLDPIVAYPEFKRPMFEPLRDLSEDLLLPGIKDIPLNTIALLVTNPAFLNSYMVGLNHEMARELLWREYPTDQRGSYFRQFWDASVAIERERMEFPTEDDKKIIEKYRDIPEIHKWKESPLKEIHKWKDTSPNEETPTVAQAERPILLIKGELLMRYPGAIIYASKAKFKNSKPVLPVPSDEKEEIKLPVLRGTIPPDVTLLGFDISIDNLCGDDEKDDPGYFFIIQEQPSEPRFAIDVDEDTIPDPDSLQSWNDLNWNYITLLPGSNNNNIDLENGLLKGKQIGGVTWGSHAADIANILLQQPVRIAVHASELMKNLESKENEEEED